MIEQFQKFYASPVGSALRTFFFIVLGLAVDEWQRLGHFDFSNLESWVIKALVALGLGVGAASSRIANPKDELQL